MSPCNILFYLCNRYRFYKARKQLAAIDWNYHLDRKVAVGSKGGEARHSGKYNQRTKEWNTRIIKVDKDYDYGPVIMAKVFRRRMEDVLHIDRHVSLSENDPKRIASTIAHTAPVSSKELFQRHQTRFQTKKWVFNGDFHPRGGGGGGTPDFKLQGLSRDFCGGVEIFDLGIFGGQWQFCKYFVFFFNRDFNVCIKPPGNVYGLEISAWNLFEIKFWPGHFLGFWFLHPFNHRCHLKSGVQ